MQVLKQEADKLTYTNKHAPGTCYMIEAVRTSGTYLTDCSDRGRGTRITRRQSLFNRIKKLMAQCLGGFYSDFWIDPQAFFQQVA